MVKTQVYLTESEMSALEALAVQKGKKKSQLIREAIDNLLEKYNSSKRQKILDRAAGMWKDRDDLPDFTAIRKSMDRNVSL